MCELSLTELANKRGNVLAITSQEPVHIQQHGKSRYVLLSVQKIEVLNKKENFRRSVRAKYLLEDKGQKSIIFL